MAQDGDAGGGDFSNGWCHFLATLELYALDAALLDESDGRGEGLLWRYLIGSHGQIADLMSWMRRRCVSFYVSLPHRYVITGQEKGTKKADMDDVQ